MFGIINDISCYGTGNGIYNLHRYEGFSKTNFNSGAADEVRKALQNPDDLNIQFRTFEKIQKFALRISSVYFCPRIFMFMKFPYEEI